MNTSYRTICQRRGPIMACCLLLASCGDGGGGAATDSNVSESNSTQRGTLVNESLVQSLSTDQFTLDLNSSHNGQLALGWAGPLSCGVSIYHIEYWTVAPTPPGGGSAPPTLVSAALMVPSGASTQCLGPRPIVLYAHGWADDPTFNMADVSSYATGLVDGETIAAFFAAQGYIVVAPNRAGYDVSTLGYEPYLNADQNSKDMMDALTAATTALTGPLSSAANYNGKLFVVGYSEGGFVSMATDKAMQAAGIKVTASAPISALSAIEADQDAQFLGSTLGPAVYAFLTTSYQNAYGNVYSSLSDIYSAPYATNFTPILDNTLYPPVFNNTPASTGNPQLDALLQPPTAPIFARWFGTPYVITDVHRQSYVLDMLDHPDGAAPHQMPGVPLATNPQNTLRQDLQLNDMRSWTPQMPMLLCGGQRDPNVLFDVNTGTMAAYWSMQASQGLVTTIDLDATPAPGDAYAAERTGFQQYEAYIAATYGELPMLETYHDITEFFCMQAVRQFFAGF